MKANQVLTADYDFSDEPIETSDIDGLDEAIERVRETKEREFVRCDERVSDYDVYWNESTDSVRIGVVCLEASYEVQE